MPIDSNIDNLVLAKTPNTESKAAVETRLDRCELLSCLSESRTLIFAEKPLLHVCHQHLSFLGQMSVRN